jgi:nitrite reductase/ring-hydroxylating ferredoxin subunit
MAAHPVARTDEIPPGGRKVVEVERRSIGIFNVRGNYYALRNACPHQGGPLCLGHVTGLISSGRPGEYRWERDGEILVCPWHAWEFDITTGRSVFDPHETRVRSYPVSVEKVETYPLSVENGVVMLHL